MKKITIELDTEFIPAAALLKLAGVVESGGQASYEIEQGHVAMDGIVLKEKRKKVRPGSTVVLNHEYAIYVTSCR
ncbi:MAG: RNA-binding S4 domain-containing protein [Acidaminococcaceae bacterium]|nr:RNA-binding S4 domain-containing protein [Acidaminococcaceae bacterium]